MIRIFKYCAIAALGMAAGILDAVIAEFKTTSRRTDKRVAEKGWN